MTTPAHFSVERGVDLDLSDLLATMTIDRRWVSGCEKDESTDSTKVTQPIVQDTLMSDDPSYLSDTSESTSSTNEESCGCAMLQSIQTQLDHYRTTGGDYLEAIFIHRALFAAYPPGHPSCAKAFSDIAFSMERRAWRADRDADTEAVVAFHHEAWMIAAAFS